MRGLGAQAIGRLTKRSDFVAAASGRRFHTERVTVQGRWRDNASGSGLRIGFTVTKRVGHATERNRIKRRLRAAALDALPQEADMAVDLPVDIVVIARRPLLSADYRLIVEDLARALRFVAKPKRSAGDPPQPEGERRRTPHA